MEDKRLSLKMARIGVGLSQAEIADELGVNINTYGRWEKDPGVMSINDAVRVCRIVGREFDEIKFLPIESI